MNANTGSPHAHCQRLQEPRVLRLRRAGVETYQYEGVDSFGDLPLNFVLDADYGTMVPRAVNVEFNTWTLLLRDHLQMKLGHCGAQGGRTTCLCLWTKVVRHFITF